VTLCPDDVSKSGTSAMIPGCNATALKSFISAAVATPAPVPKNARNESAGNTFLTKMIPKDILLMFSLLWRFDRSFRRARTAHGIWRRGRERGHSQRVLLTSPIQAGAYGLGRWPLTRVSHALVRRRGRWRPRCALGCKYLHHGADPLWISVTAVRANQLPRAVSRADALPASLQSVSMPSRPRSATVMPKIGLSRSLADDAAHAPLTVLSKQLQ